MEKKNLNEVFSDFREFLRAHAKPLCSCDDCDDDDDVEIPEEVAEHLKKQADLFCNIRPKAVDILMEKEHEFVDAIRQLVDKHKSLETVEQIEKLTKDILKLCK
jgi:hypothetical protein